MRFLRGRSCDGEGMVAGSLRLRINSSVRTFKGMVRRYRTRSFMQRVEENLLTTRRTRPVSA